MSQEKSSQNVFLEMRLNFGDRLRKAFGGANNAVIARQLDISEPAARNYLEGRVPKADVLLQIMNLTNCSLHWLLTGEGPEKRDKLLTSDSESDTVFADLGTYVTGSQSLILEIGSEYDSLDDDSKLSLQPVLEMVRREIEFYRDAQTMRVPVYKTANEKSNDERKANNE